MSDGDQNPLDDPQLAEAWGAFAQLAAAAESPFDEAAFAARVAARLDRMRRRKRLVVGAGLLAAAASLLVMVGLATRSTQETNLVAANAPEKQPKATGPNPTPESPSIAEIQQEARGEAEATQETVAFEPWNDELANETASLAEQVQTVEYEWREQPDSIALFQTQVDQFEQDMTSGEL